MAQVRSHLEYDNLIWGPHFKCHAVVVEKIQRRATKREKTIKDQTYEERLRHLNLPSLKLRWRRGDVIFAYKVFSERINVGQNDVLWERIGFEKEDLFTISQSSPRGHD